MKSILCYLLLLLSAVTSFAQERMTGIVADSASFSPLPYVTIRLKHKPGGTTTDHQGNFSILATRKDTLVLSLVGYETIEQSLQDWEPSMILLPEKVTLLNTITIRDKRIDNPYEGVFDDQHAAWRQLNKKLPFYYSRTKKQKIKINRLASENYRVKTYVDIVINKAETKDGLMEKHQLTEAEYYNILGHFNEKYHSVMYYLTAPELLSLLNNFFSEHAPNKPKR